MAIRWRKDGTLVCAAMSEPEEEDTYIGDRLSYELTTELKVIVADPNHKANGLWYWTRDALIVANPLWIGLGPKPKNQSSTQKARKKRKGESPNFKYLRPSTPKVIK